MKQQLICAIVNIMEPRAEGAISHPAVGRISYSGHRSGCDSGSAHPPNAVLYRPTMHFALPRERWFCGRVKALVRDAALGGPLAPTD